MENLESIQSIQSVVLVIHLILALAIIGLVLIQRSEGGGLGIGGGGGMGGFASARGTANMLTRLTAIFATGFFITSLALGILAAKQSSASRGILEQIDPAAIEKAEAKEKAQPEITFEPPTSSNKETSTPADASASETPAQVKNNEETAPAAQEPVSENKAEEPKTESPAPAEEPVRAQEKSEAAPDTPGTKKD